MFHGFILPGLISVGRFNAVLLGLFCSLAAALPAAAEDRYVPYSGIIHGTEGAEPVELRIRNETNRPMSCTASLAHWYSDVIGTERPGGTLGVTLWHDPGTGVLNLMNTCDARMPIEAIWCGRVEELHATRDRVALPFAAGPAPDVIERVCRDGPAGRLSCDGADG